MLITIYEKSSLPDYIEKTANKGRILHIREGLPANKLASLQLAGKISKEKYFDTKDLKDLPSIKSLQVEYSVLLERKKEIYPTYRKLREQMKDLLTAKANVDRLLNMESEKNQEDHHTRNNKIM